MHEAIEYVIAPITPSYFHASEDVLKLFTSPSQTLLNSFPFLQPLCSLVLTYILSNFLFTIGAATAIRFSDDAAYIKWSSGSICERFTVTIQDKHEKKSHDVQSNQLVLTKLQPDTSYRITVSGLSQDGVRVWRGTVPISSKCL